jgi:hypothetical protein
LAKEFDIADYTADRAAEKVRELRSHLHETLLPGARAHAEGIFIVPFVEYLDRQAERFESSISGPLDLLAWTARNLLEFWSLISQVFVSAETRAYFFGETYLDVEEIRMRIEKMGIPKHMLSNEPPEWDAIPQKRILLFKDRYGDYFFKLCSKYVHPSATLILAPQAMPGAFIFYFFGWNYLTKSYNFLVDRVFKTLDAPESSESLVTEGGQEGP